MSQQTTEKQTVQVPVQTEKKKRPQFYNGVRVRMPEDYDFNTWGKDWSQYNKDFKMRTDAVWEKQQLKDWFRLTKKIFFFNTIEMKYQFLEPEDIYSLVLEPWGFQEEEVFNWTGYSPTGSTTSFQRGIGPKQRLQTTFNSFYSMPDYYMLCAMRFEKWWRCDMVHDQERTTKYDRNPKHSLRDMKPQQHYPCFRDYYEASYACADNIMKYLVELAYAKKATNFWEDEHLSKQIQMMPVVWDSPTNPERITYTY